jgi:integrase
MEARCEKITAVAEECKMAFVFSCFTGLRISDIRSLRWCDIQGINGIPHVRTTMVKTKKPIFVPLSMNAMLWMPKRKDETDDTSLVFANLPSTSATLNDHVRRVAKAAKIDKSISFHTSRHTFATLTLKASKDLYVVSKLLGHASINTTRVYAEVLDSTLEDAIIKQEGILEKTTPNAMNASVSQ